MIALTATLTAAQKQHHVRPYVELKAYETIAEVNRLRWTRLYTGAEADNHHAAAVPADGSLLRAYLAQDGAQYDLQYQRVASPDPGSNFGSWTTPVSDVSGTSGVALANAGAKVSLFYVANDKRSIKVKTSTDNGATFGAAAGVVVAAADVKFLAAAYKDASTIGLFFATASAIYSTIYAAGAWGAATLWTNSANTIAGLACHFLADWNLVIAGTDTADRPKLWTAVFGDGYSEPAGVWSPLLELMAAEATSGVSYSCPTIAQPDVYRLAFIEKYTGAGAYTRLMLSHGVGNADFIDNRWREPWPLNVSCSYGVALCCSASTAWLSTPSGVWKAAISIPTLDLTTDLLAATATVDVEGASLVAAVRNDAAQYLEGASGKGQAWLGCELRLGLGYHTPAGDEASAHLSFWVDDYEFQTAPGTANLVLYARGPWSLLAGWVARRQLNWPAGSLNVFQLLGFFVSRAGLSLSAVDPSPDLSSLTPSFTVNPGENGATAIRRLLAMVPDGLRFQNATGILSNRSASDPSSYSYGTTHPILRGRYHHGLSAANRAQVYGSNAFGEALAWEEIDLVYDRLRQVHDESPPGAPDCAMRAEAELLKAGMESIRGGFLSLPNCGLELYDVVDLTESRAELSAAKRRVLGITTRYDARKGVYEQEVSLGEG